MRYFRTPEDKERGRERLYSRCVLYTRIKAENYTYISVLVRPRNEGTLTCDKLEALYEGLARNAYNFYTSWKLSVKYMFIYARPYRTQEKLRPHTRFE